MSACIQSLCFCNGYSVRSIRSLLIAAHRTISVQLSHALPAVACYAQLNTRRLQYPPGLPRSYGDSQIRLSSPGEPACDESCDGGVGIYSLSIMALRLILMAVSAMLHLHRRKLMYINQRLASRAWVNCEGCLTAPCCGWSQLPARASIAVPVNAEVRAALLSSCSGLAVGLV